MTPASGCGEFFPPQGILLSYLSRLAEHEHGALRFVIDRDAEALAGLHCLINRLVIDRPYLIYRIVIRFTAPVLNWTVATRVCFGIGKIEHFLLSQARIHTHR